MPISDDYARIPCNSITIARTDRQRTKVDLGLKESIANHGVLKPIILTRSLELVAGERRLTASVALGLEDIPARFIDEISPEELQVVELEENLKRVDLPWMDEVRSISRLHKAYQRINPSWGAKDTARELAMADSYLLKMVRLGDHLGNPKIAEQTTVSSALGVLDRLIARKSQEAMSDLLSISSDAISGAIAAGNKADAQAPLSAFSPGTTTPPPSTRDQVLAVLRAAEPTAKRQLGGTAPPDNILNADFTEWAKEYSGPKFNFLHCDFPYGVGLFDGNRLKADTAYSDTKEVYFALIESLCQNIDRLLTSNAHVMFWFSMEYYARTLDMFRKLAPDIVFFRHPLVWVKSDNAGLLVDRNRGPRRIYETALMGIRGERFVAKAVSNAYSAPTERSLHPSTKPEPVLKHFFQMFVDNNTSMLDPTCGGGSALRAAEDLGAQRALGLERDPEFHGAAVGALHKSRQLREASKNSVQRELPFPVAAQ
jgi:ParB/RepB/Spo0J family partition protein